MMTCNSQERQTWAKGREPWRKSMMPMLKADPAWGHFSKPPSVAVAACSAAGGSQHTQLRAGAGMMCVPGAQLAAAYCYSEPDWLLVCMPCA